MRVIWSIGGGLLVCLILVSIFGTVWGIIKNARMCIREMRASVDRPIYSVYKRALISGTIVRLVWIAVLVLIGNLLYAFEP